MQTPLSESFHLESAIFAFTYEPKVAAAVTRAGGMGVLGALRFTADELEEALTYMDKECDGRPYGVDVVMPVKTLSDDTAGEQSATDLERDLKGMIPEEHWDFVNQLLDDHGVPREVPGETRHLLGWTDTTATPQIEVALEHPISLLASALGPPPSDVIAAAHDKDVRVAALVGRADQALRQQAAGVDIVVAQGTEAGGHTGDIATMVLVPEVVEALPGTPVLAAGGIGRGSQIAAAEALGASGVWTGSIWLDTSEHGEGYSGIRQRIHSATSSDTIRSRAMTGKPARQLRTAWIEAWERADTPAPLGMPLQYMLAAEANRRIAASDADELKGTPIGQIVGTMNETRPVADVLDRLLHEYREAVARICAGPSNA